jgi:hypothetical protein
MAGEILHKFADDARKSSDKPLAPPNAISAKALDGNFTACSPLKATGPNRPYIVRQTKDGWELDPTVDFLICENGQPRRYRFFAQKVATTTTE